MSKLKASRVEDRGVVRYLNAQEEQRLRGALLARDTKRRLARASANAWRQVRGYEPLAALGTYTDHFTPLVLVACFGFTNCGTRSPAKLVMAGVDINTVRGLLGHTDLNMTLWYAHLAPAVKAAAVEKLVPT